MPLGEMSPGLAKLNGPQHPWVSVLNSFQSKRPSAQSAEGMGSPIVRKPKARAHLSKPKSQRSPYQKSFSAKLRRRVIVSDPNSKVTNDDVCHALHLQARKLGVTP